MARSPLVTDTQIQMPELDQRYLTVSELTQLLKEVLAETFPAVRFTGEIHQISRAGSGHLYLTIRDDESQLSCAIWRTYASALKFAPEVGQKVECHGKPDIFAKSGRFQIIIHRMELAGEGALQRKFLELKEKLTAEGLFAQERKRALPFLPRKIGIVTSAQGAVIHDIMVRVRERMPSLKVLLADVRVQGEGAAREIAEAIGLLNSRADVEVIIVARGGGSIEDLWAFNEEETVRAIFASRVPVVSGVGHEVDVTLADLAADVRAPTPTAAAEIVVPRRDELLLRVSELNRRLSEYERWLAPLQQVVDELTARLMRRSDAAVDEARLRLARAESQLRALHPQTILERLKHRLQSYLERLGNGIQGALRHSSAKLENLCRRLERRTPAPRVSAAREGLARMESRFHASAAKSLAVQRASLDQLAVRLEALDPRRVLERGYAIVESEGRIVRSASELSLETELSLTLHGGRAGARVTSLE